MSSNSSAETVLEQLMNTINTDSSIIPSLIHGLGAFLGFSLVEEGEPEQGLQHLVAIMLLAGDEGLEELVEEFISREGLKPATKDSIQALRKVVFTEDDKEKECAICLDELEIGGEGKEMPCMHMYHEKCIEKWLGIHGSCPVCRHEIPMDGKQSMKKHDGEQNLE
ncbi:RING-type E3 ubiquitin transferase [Ranunculus cassubicifolius]